MDQAESTFMKLIHQRRSTRAFSTQPVEPEKIMKCLEAARLAPSACNSQPWHFIIVDDAALCKQLAEETLLPLTSMNQFTKDAPAFVVIVTEPSNIASGLAAIVKKINYRLIDIGIAALQFCLRAEELGLGTCMLGWFQQKKVKKLLAIPQSKGCNLIIAIGYPKEHKANSVNRKVLEQIYSRNRYGQK
ncbi:MAG: nitroreductase family protein [Spirochaetales bacterium]|nr:nitroreductase family protein [Spirochaetales bacterium]